MDLKISLNQEFYLLKRELNPLMTGRIDAQATKFAISDASRLGMARARKYLKGKFPIDTIKRRLKQYIRSKEEGRYGVAIFLGYGGVDLQYLDPHKQGRGIVANGHYYAQAFFKKNAINRKVWMRKWQSREDTDRKTYEHELWKVRQWFPDDQEIDETLLEILQEMERVFLDRFLYHVIRLTSNFVKEHKYLTWGAG